MSQTETSARSPWAAVVLSLFSTGLGHIYCGRIVTGLVLFLASLLFAPAVVLAALLAPSTAVLVGLLLSVAAVLGLYLFAVLDAFRVARRAGEHYTLREYNRGLVYALFILVGVTYPVGVVSVLRANVFEAFLLPVASEVPNFLPGDRVLVNKLAYRLRFPRRGDVVVLRVPGEPGRTWIKRVIALPGDTVAVRAGQVYVNGKKLERDPVPRASLAAVAEFLTGDVFAETNAGSRYLIMLGPASAAKADFAEKKVPEGACFVLGDNRNHSADSRDFGFVPLGEILGPVQYVYLPAQTWARFGACTD
jgi:signal peptidase I